MVIGDDQPNTVVKTTTMSPEPFLQTALQRVQQNHRIFGDQFPNHGEGTRYVLKENSNWVAGFWPGMVWLIYAHTGDAQLRDYATTLLPTFKRRLDENIHINHDMGFLFLLSARAQYELTGDKAARALALRSADILLGRYRPKGQYIQAWGPVGEARRGGQIIMDTMMNLPLLFWASEQTDDAVYRAAALDHARATATHLMRPDGSTYHTFFFDQESGNPLRGATHQGAADDSLWARGQAWGICGFAMAAVWCPDELFLIDTARKMAQRFMAELPPDDVPLWDLWLPEGAPRYRDSSASAIALCGLLRLQKLDPSNAAEYQAYARRLFDGVVQHCWDNHPDAQGLLKHGAQHVPKNIAPDGYLIFGDYYMLEALMMMSGSVVDFCGSTVKGSGNLDERVS